VRGTELAPGHGEALRIYAGELNDLAMASVAAGHAIEVTVTGATDALGAPANNLELAQRRAEAVASALFDAGLNPAIGAPDIAADGAEISSDESRRLARVTVRLREAPGSP
jgi:flagellar motor protein MotB